MSTSSVVRSRQAAARGPADRPGAAPRGGRLSIGALARATGIPVETLRTWEHRYGFPVPERKPSGHRVYSPMIVPRLRRIAEALARGHRASEAVAATDGELAALLDATQVPTRAPSTASTTTDRDLGALFDAVRAFDAERLRQALVADWARLGPLEFVERRIAPLLRAVGEAWSEGSLHIRHEHFVSECIGDLLRLLRMPFEERADGPLVIFTTLPGEAHGLGLQMAALVVATTGCRILYLGTGTPVDQVVSLAVDLNARAVALSISAASAGPSTRRAFTRLKTALPRRVELVAGGEGVPRAQGVSTVADFAALASWAERLRAA